MALINFSNKNKENDIQTLENIKEKSIAQTKAVLTYQSKLYEDVSFCNANCLLDKFKTDDEDMIRFQRFMSLPSFNYVDKNIMDYTFEPNFIGESLKETKLINKFLNEENRINGRTNLKNIIDIDRFARFDGRVGIRFIEQRNGKGRPIYKDFVPIRTNNYVPVYKKSDKYLGVKELFGYAIAMDINNDEDAYFNDYLSFGEEVTFDKEYWKYSKKFDAYIHVSKDSFIIEKSNFREVIYSEKPLFKTNILAIDFVIDLFEKLNKNLTSAELGWIFVKLKDINLQETDADAILQMTNSGNIDEQSKELKEKMEEWTQNVANSAENSVNTLPDFVDGIQRFEKQTLTKDIIEYVYIGTEVTAYTLMQRPIMLNSGQQSGNVSATSMLESGVDFDIKGNRKRIEVQILSFFKEKMNWNEFHFQKRISKAEKEEVDAINNLALAFNRMHHVNTNVTSNDPSLIVFDEVFRDRMESYRDQQEIVNIDDTG